ncbi:PAS domain S-box protein [bacterium]|nr:PAS domain S-box protein [bacterium]
MDLRRRTLLVVALSFAGIAIALYFTLNSTVLSRLSSYENADARRSADVQQRTFEARLQEIRASAEQRAKSAALQDFMSQRSASRLQSALPAGDLQKAGFKLALVVDSRGQVLAGYFDPMASWNSKVWTSQIAGQIKSAGWPDWPALIAGGKLSGVINADGTTLLVGASPIRGRSGPRGYLVLGQPLDLSGLFTSQPGDEVRPHARWQSDAKLPRDMRDAAQKNESSDQPVYANIDQNSVAAYLFIPSLAANDTLIVRVSVPRRITQTGLEFGATALLVLVVSVVVCGSLLWLILDRQVLSRLGKLSEGVASVGAKGDPSLRVQLVGDDEVARLSMSINQMLGELERSQTQLRHSEQRFSALSAASFEAILIHDGSRIVDVNQALLDMFGHSRDQLVGSELEILAPHWLADGIWQLAQKAGEEPFEAFGATRGGATIPLEVRCRTLPYREQHFSVAAMRDISERRKAEAALRESEERYRRLVDLAQEGIVSNDANEVITFSNPTFASVLGYSPHQLVGRSLIELCTPSSAERMLQEASKRRSGLSGTYEVELVSRDNRIRAFHLTARPMFDESGVYEGSLGVFTDITERKQTEQAWLAAQKAESLGVLAGGIAHDFNNLLVGIIGNISLAIDSLPPASPVHKYLSEVDKASQRASELVEQMLAYSGKGRLALRKVDLNNVIEETIRLMGTSLPRHVQLELDLGRPLSTIDADEGLMRQMITSFLLNSVEAIRDVEGSIRIHTGQLNLDAAALRAIAPSAEMQPGSFVFVSVTDNGIGMEPEVRDKVFDPFFSTKFAGRGLGLAAVQGIVKRHRGAIQLESEPGRGSSFRVILPVSAGKSIDGEASETPTQVRSAAVRRSDPESPAPKNGHARLDVASLQQEAMQAASAANTVQEEEQRPQHRAMVVAEEATVRQVTSRILEQHGYTVRAQAGGSEAIQDFGDHHQSYDLVLLDLDLSDMAGLELFEALCRINPALNAVLISGEMESGGVTSSNGVKAAVLRKPFAPAQLLQEIKELARA